MYSVLTITLCSSCKSSLSSILFQAARPIKTQQAKRQRQTEQAYKYADKISQNKILVFFVVLTLADSGRDKQERVNGVGAVDALP